jgi:hypothetical protein
MAAPGLAQRAGLVIALPEDDRAYIAQYLGEGVVGEAVPAQPVDNVAALLDLESKKGLVAEFVHGKQKGETRQIEFRQLDRRDGTVAFRLGVGPLQVMYGEISPGGSLHVHSIEDKDQGVVSRYSPPEPVLIRGMKPGDRKEERIKVSVFDLSRPERRTHKGQIDLVYQYMGAYRVTVPHGTHDALLFKWTYSGKVGPARIEDRQYFFFAPGVGPVAMIEQTDVSAMLVYQEHDKVAMVLTEIRDEE